MIYLIQSGNFLKIGYTSDIVKRMKQYNTCNPDYILLGITEGNREDEKRLHNKFSKLKHKNEWFYYNDSILKEFKSYGTVSDDEFFCMFSCGSNALYKLQSVIAIKLVLMLCCSLKSNSAILHVSNRLRGELGVNLGISQKKLDEAFELLEEHNIIYRKNGNIKLNPIMFWKGNIKSRNYTILEDMEELIENNKSEE